MRVMDRQIAGRTARIVQLLSDAIVEQFQNGSARGKKPILV